jgi:hypothetical protein
VSRSWDTRGGDEQDPEAGRERPPHASNVVADGVRTDLIDPDELQPDVRAFLFEDLI